MNIQSYNIIKVLGGHIRRPSLWERMQRWLLAFGAITALVAPSSHAIDTDKVAHASVSAVGTVALYGLYKVILNKDCRLDGIERSCPLSKGERLGAASFAAMTMFFGGLVKEMGDRQVDGGDIMANGLGAAGAILPIVAFEF